MSNNNQKPEEQRKKKCPFLNDWCIGNACALHQQVTMPLASGLVQKIQMCGFNALCVMLSEINAKTVGPQQQQKIVLPGFGGN